MNQQIVDGMHTKQKYQISSTKFQMWASITL